MAIPMRPAMGFDSPDTPAPSSSPSRKLMTWGDSMFCIKDSTVFFVLVGPQTLWRIYYKGATCMVAECYFPDSTNFHLFPTNFPFGGSVLVKKQ
jgi:hypothetical protein